MSRLRERERTHDLPKLIGEVQLVAPTEGEVRAWVERWMRRPDGPAIRSVTWEFARWKPGVSTTCSYDVCFEDGEPEVVVAKTYADGKDKILTQRPLKAKSWSEVSPSLIPRAKVPDRPTLLFVNAADRELKGTPVFLLRKKLASFLHKAGLAPPGMVRRRRLEARLVRYKPERRAVYRVHVRLRDAGKTRFDLGCRIHPLAEASRIVAAREAFEAAGGKDVPRLSGHIERYGILFEPWLDVETFDPDTFEHAEDAGTVLARLHATPSPPALSATARAALSATDFEGLRPLLRVDAALEARLFPLEIAPCERVTWCHNDFHPDQVARRRDGTWMLLDLDELGPGDPVADLANWIADRAVDERLGDFDELSRALLAGYARGRGAPVDRARLLALTARGLVHRGAAAVRRLQKDALDVAAFALDTARSFVP